jgi:PhoD related phosphatase
LDDHYCARPHKRERNDFLLRLQDFAQKHQVRITMLSGDVHLAAIGRFYAKPSLNIPVEHDHRYMANVISSAITNKPPPEAVSNILARRNKIHHLDNDTDEQLLDFFDIDVHGQPRQRNKNTMPSRNYSIITESPINRAPTIVEGQTNGKKHADPKNAVGLGELGAGTEHAAVEAEKVVETIPGALNVAIRVEIDKHDPEGKTRKYGFSSKWPS